MKDINPKKKSFSDLLDEIGRAVMNTARYAARTLERMSWPAILLGCVLLALVLTILPLAIMLFVVFMLVKLAVGGCGPREPRQRREEPL